MFNSCARRLIRAFVAASALAGAASSFAVAPGFTAFSPAAGKLGTTVTFTGTNFTAPLTVTFNGVATSSVTVVSSTKATATVPFTASTGKITLKTSGGSATSSAAFSVDPGLVASASNGPPTSARTLYYSGFGSHEAVDFYFDTENFALASASAGGAGNLSVVIPEDAAPGTHWLTAVGRRAADSGQIAFVVRADWSQIGFSPNHQSNNLYENILDSGTVNRLQEAWRTPPVSLMQSTPAVAGGVAYATFGDGSIRAFDEATGAQKWLFATGGDAMFSSPAVSGGVVYAGSGDGYLYAVNAATGTLKWRFATNDRVFSSPTVSGGIVYFGSYDKSVYAVNANSGSLVWSFATGASVYSSPAVAKGVVYVGSFDNNVYALNAATGVKLWSTATGGFVFAAPVLVGGLVCIGSYDGNMYAFRAADGTTAWSYTAGGSIQSTAAVIGTSLFFGANDGRVYSITAGGKLRWSIMPPAGAPIIYAPVCAANDVVCATDGVYTYALAQGTGAVLTTLPAGSDFGSPVVVNGAVLVGDKTDGVLSRYTLDAARPAVGVPRPAPLSLVPHALQ